MSCVRNGFGACGEGEIMEVSDYCWVLGAVCRCGRAGGGGGRVKERETLIGLVDDMGGIPHGPKYNCSCPKTDDPLARSQMIQGSKMAASQDSHSALVESICMFCMFCLLQRGHALRCNRIEC